VTVDIAAPTRAKHSVQCSGGGCFSLRKMAIGEWAAVGQKAVWAGALMGWLWEKNKKNIKENGWAARFNGPNAFGLAERIEIGFFQILFQI
jgi:hypothetical protein